MNKYQEALYTLTDWFHSYKNEKGITVHERHITPKYEDAKKTIQELVDKATPKKAIEFTSEITNSEEAYTFYTCPKCRMLLSNDIYCPKCGQKLYFGE